ncbi:hypothetical protein Taro_008846, partial [Colocasia esculenta]|nr:hypothetical protein [Colocasia esculenta]
LQSFYKIRSTLLDSKVDSTSLPSKFLKNKLPVRLTLAERISRFCHGSVDTVPGSVDTRSESLKQFHEDRVHCVDTVPGSVDTSPSLQKTQLPDWDSVSKQSQAVSTLVPGSVDTSLSSQKNSFAEMGHCVDTLPGGVGTLRLKLKKREFLWTRGCLGIKGFDLAERGFPDLAPSPEVASHPFKRKDVRIKGNLWREACCARQGSRSN